MFQILVIYGLHMSCSCKKNRGFWDFSLVTIQTFLKATLARASKSSPLLGVSPQTFGSCKFYHQLQ